MPRGLTLAQRLVDPEGVPTGTAKATLAILAVAAAAAGFVAHGDGDPGTGSQRGAAIAVARLAGELPEAREPSAPHLTSTARLPALPAVRPRRTRARAPEPAAPPAATPLPVPTAVPTPAAPVAVPAPAPPAASRPPRRPAPSFDLSG